MSIFLKSNWDISITPPIHNRKMDGYFVGRKIELDMLVNEIKGKRSGSILVSGHRGVGKTSLVYKTIHEIKKEDKRVISVFLNASQLDAEMNTVPKQETPINPKQIIKNLIRRLYSTISFEKIEKLNSDTEIKIRSLYSKATAESFSITREKEVSKTRSIATTIIADQEARISIKFSRSLYLLFLLIVSVGLYSLSNIDNIPIILRQILFYSSPIPILQSPFTFNLLIKKFTKEVDTKEGTTTAQELYKFDNSLGNLEYDLELIHKDLSENENKLIYVIDELDKLKAEDVYEIVKYFKNLFTLSEAIFIFIGGESIYNYVSKSEENVYRNAEHTYFTSRYFLTRPNWKEIDNFLDEIIESSSGSRKLIQIFKRSLSFDSKNDFFDIRTAIRNNIARFDDSGKPVITFAIDGENQLKHNLHKAITLFEHKYFSASHSSWHENETIIRALFNRAHEIQRGYAGSEFTDPKDGSLSNEVIREFQKLLWRLGVFQDNTFALEPVTIRGLAVPIKRYTYSGNAGEEPLDSLEAQVEFEQRFINSFIDYSEYLVALINPYYEAIGKRSIVANTLLETPANINHVKELDNFGYGFSPAFIRDYKLHQEITSGSLQTTRLAVEKRTKETLQNIPKIMSSMTTILATLFSKAYSDQILKLQTLDQNASLFAGSAQPIREFIIGKTIKHIIVYRDISRQIMFIENNVQSLKEVGKEIRENSSTHRIVTVTDKIEAIRLKGHSQIQYGDASLLSKSLISAIKNLTEFIGN